MLDYKRRIMITKRILKANGFGLPLGNFKYSVKIREMFRLFRSITLRNCFLGIFFNFVS